MTQPFRVADITTNCSTREQGRHVYPALADFARTLLVTGDDLSISFADVKLVTPSFLDETIVRLLRESSMRKVTLSQIRDFPVRSLERMLREIGRHVEVQQQGEGVYRFAAA